MIDGIGLDGTDCKAELALAELSVKRDTGMHRCERCGEYFVPSDGHSHWCTLCYCEARRVVSCILCGKEMMKRGCLAGGMEDPSPVSFSCSCDEDYLRRELSGHLEEFDRNREFGGLSFDFCYPAGCERPMFLMESDGFRHRRPVRRNGCSDSEMYRDFIRCQCEDWLKEQYCVEHGIPLIRVCQSSFACMGSDDVYRQAEVVNRRSVNRIRMFGICDTDVVNDGNCTTFTIQSGVTCTFKCDKESHCQLCQNWPIRNQKVIELGIDKVIAMYDNGSPLSHSITFQGLEPLDSLKQLLWFAYAFRKRHGDRLCIWTGYTEDECRDLVELLRDRLGMRNIIFKFGRFVPGCESHFDPVLKLNLVSPNQYGVRIC